MFPKTIFVAVILCACYLGMIQGQLPDIPVVGGLVAGAVPAAGGGLAGGLAGGAVQQALGAVQNPGGTLHGNKGVLPSVNI